MQTFSCLEDTDRRSPHLTSRRDIGGRQGSLVRLYQIWKPSGGVPWGVAQNGSQTFSSEQVPLSIRSGPNPAFLPVPVSRLCILPGAFFSLPLTYQCSCLSE